MHLYVSDIDNSGWSKFCFEIYWCAESRGGAGREKPDGPSWAILKSYIHVFSKFVWNFVVDITVRGD